MKIVTANLVASRDADEVDHWDSKAAYTGGEGDWVEYSVRVRGSRVRHTVMYVGPDGTCRREQGGPIVPGPYGALIPQASVIAAYALPKAQEIVELDDGDVIVCNGTPLVVWHNFYREAMLLDLDGLERRDPEAAAEALRGLADQANWA